MIKDIGYIERGDRVLFFTCSELGQEWVETHLEDAEDGQFWMAKKEADDYISDMRDDGLSVEEVRL